MERIFKLKAHNTSVKTEVIAGLTTFFTMAYIIFVNQGILGEGGAGMPNLAVMTATCISAAIGTLLIGFMTNYPLAQAPGMGLNAFFAYTMCLGMGMSWQSTLSAVFIGGVFFILLTVTGARKAIVDAIPLGMKKAISAGIGFFIALIGFNNAGLLSSEKGTIIGMGNLNVSTTLLALFGLILTIVLVVTKVPGALFVSIIGTSLIGCFLQFVLGINVGVSLPESWVPHVDFSTFGALFSGFGDLFSIGVMPLITALISLVLVDMFDTIGTLIGAADKAGYLDENGNLPKVEKAMLADAIATCAGAIVGTSTVTTYVESTAGISAGGRTGLTSLTTGVCFLLALFLSPVLGFVPGAATAPILIVVGVMMCSALRDIDWHDITVAIPAFITIFGMPLFYSISDGIAFGFISFVVVKLATRRVKEIHPLMYVIMALFLLKYVLSAL